MKINKLKMTEAEKYIQKAFEIWAKRSKKEWKLDLTHLSEYGIDERKILQEKNKINADK